MEASGRNPAFEGARRRRSGRVSLLPVLVASVVVAAGLAVFPADPADAATTLTVNSTGDQSDRNPGDGICLTGAGKCSLRAAIEEANALAGPDTIAFAIPGNGVHTITISDTLVVQDRSGATTIDGYTQSGASVNTHATKSNAQIKVEITTSSATWPMLLITSPANTVRGLAIYGNGPRIELRGEEADGNRIVGNFIGTNAAATATSASPTSPPELRLADAGIGFNLGPDRNVVGTAALADRNVISGNRLWGIRINHGETSQNIVENNIFGLSPDLSRKLTQSVAVDIQWWTWGNYVTDNLMSGHGSNAIDISHSAVGNAIIGNRIGTGADGNSANSVTANGKGIAFKDNPTGNHVADNVIANSNGDGIWHRQNYTGANTIVNNRIGVGSNGARIGNRGDGVYLRGHDDLYRDNIIANNSKSGFYITDTSLTGPGSNFPPEATERNLISQNTFYGNAQPVIDIEDRGQNSNDSGDGDGGAHGLLNHPEITGLGPGEVYGRACGGCTVEVYASGTIRADGTLDIADPAAGTGQGWLGTTQADGSGRFALGDARLVAGKQIRTLAVDQEGNTSELGPAAVVPTVHQGVDGDAPGSIGAIGQPTRPNPPPAYASPNGIISGSVALSSGGGIAGAAVQQFTTAEDGGRGQWVRTIQTNSSGGYAIHAAPGCWSLTFVAPDGELFTSQSRWLTRQVCVEAGQEVADVNAVVIDRSQTATLSGSVVSDGAGVPDVKVDLFASSEVGGRDGFVGFTRTGSDGAYTFDVTPGCWVMTFIAPDGRTFSNGSRFINQARCVAAGEASVGPDVVLVSNNAATLTGQILDGGAPAVGVKSNLFNVSGDGQRSSFIGPATTGADGFYSYRQSTGCYIEVLIAPEGRTFQSSGGRFVERPVCLVAPDTTTQPVANLS